MKHVAHVREVLRSEIHTIGRNEDGKVVAGDALPLPERVEIVVPEEGGNCIMYRYTRTGVFCGDTWHEDLEDAFDQAEFEYGLKSTDFLVVLYGSQASQS
ncbi:MAG: hypothetical protein JSR34_03200 [Proteobacteria bacterium]|nr:hypothetical protein [Pseudomonadota bacterium]